jgi:hypothetical protein
MKVKYKSYETEDFGVNNEPFVGSDNFLTYDGSGCSWTAMNDNLVLSDTWTFSNNLIFRDQVGNDIIKFDYDDEKIIIDGKDVTMDDKAIGEACRNFLFEMIKNQKG